MNKPISFKDYLQTQMDAHGITNCVCGRGFGVVAGYAPKILSVQPHCPQCGSGWVLSSKRRKRLIDVGNETLVECRGFACRRCGNEFTEMDILINCYAPRLKEPKQQRATIAVEKFTSAKITDLKAELNKLRIARGEEPIK